MRILVGIDPRSRATLIIGHRSTWKEDYAIGGAVLVDPWLKRISVMRSRYTPLHNQHGRNMKIRLTRDLGAVTKFSFCSLPIIPLSRCQASNGVCCYFCSARARHTIHSKYTNLGAIFSVVVRQLFNPSVLSFLLKLFACSKMKK